MTQAADFADHKGRVPLDNLEEGAEPMVSSTGLLSRPSLVSRPKLRGEALYGLAGDFVRAVEPHTEADPIALLSDVLASVGSMFGRARFVMADGSRHGPNLFVVNVGDSSKSRKGTSRNRVRSMVGPVDERWAADCQGSGLSSGEGLIEAVRDERVESQPVKKNGKPTGEYQDVVVDPGVADKRLLVTEGEFAAPLKVGSRDGNTLSPILRNAWDGTDLRSMTRNSPMRATNPHISIIGHITEQELKRYLDATDAVNGYANRFLFFCVQRSKLLPLGGAVPEGALQEIRERLEHALHVARTPREMQLDAEAKAFWCDLYEELSRSLMGLVGALTARSEAQVLRAALVYALLDADDWIRVHHLRAALALWECSEGSVRFLFGDAVGDPLADRILDLLEEAGAAGLTRSELSNRLARHTPGSKLQQALDLLAELGRARSRREPTGGRSAERWIGSECATSEGSEGTSGFSRFSRFFRRTSDQGAA